MTLALARAALLPLPHLDLAPQVLSVVDVANVWRIPNVLQAQGMCNLLNKTLALDYKLPVVLEKWHKYAEKAQVRMCVRVRVGKAGLSPECSGGDASSHLPPSMKAPHASRRWWRRRRRKRAACAWCWSCPTRAPSSAARRARRVARVACAPPAGATADRIVCGWAAAAAMGRAPVAGSCSLRRARALASDAQCVRIRF